MYAAIASKALQELAYEQQPDENGALEERFNRLCAQQGKPYNSDIRQRATDAARVALAKQQKKFTDLMAKGERPH